MKERYAMLTRGRGLREVISEKARAADDEKVHRKFSVAFANMKMALRVGVTILLVCLSCVLLAQEGDQEPPQRPPGVSMIGTLFAYGFLFQIAAIIHWSRKRPDTFWVWIIIIGGFIGAFAYFLIEGMPDFANIGRKLKGPGRRRRIRMLRAMVLDNPSAGNYEELGELLLTEKRYAEARDAYDHALAARTDLLDPFYRRALALFQLRQYEAAARDLKHVTTADPKYDYSNAFCLYARSLAAMGRKEEAQAAFEQLIERSHSAETLYEAAAFFADNGREAAARDIVQRIISREITMPRYQKRRDRTWLRKAKALGRKLRKSGGITPPVVAGNSDRA